jgi:hypothetical protein
MDKLEDLLGRYAPAEPPEVAAIKQYIQATFSADAQVGITEKAITVTVTSAALANTLRFHATKLQKAADTDKRIVLRIR